MRLKVCASLIIFVLFFFFQAYLQETCSLYLKVLVIITFDKIFILRFIRAQPATQKFWGRVYFWSRQESHYESVRSASPFVLTKDTCISISVGPFKWKMTSNFTCLFVSLSVGTLFLQAFTQKTLYSYIRGLCNLQPRCTFFSSVWCSSDIFLLFHWKKAKVLLLLLKSLDCC